LNELLISKTPLTDKPISPATIQRSLRSQPLNHSSCSASPPAAVSSAIYLWTSLELLVTKISISSQKQTSSSHPDHPIVSFRVPATPHPLHPCRRMNVVSSEAHSLVPSPIPSFEYSTILSEASPVDWLETEGATEQDSCAAPYTASSNNASSVHPRTVLSCTSTAGAQLLETSRLKHSEAERSALFDTDGRRGWNKGFESAAVMGRGLLYAGSEF